MIDTTRLREEDPNTIAEYRTYVSKLFKGEVSQSDRDSLILAVLVDILDELRPKTTDPLALKSIEPPIKITDPPPPPTPGKSKVVGGKK